MAKHFRRPECVNPQTRLHECSGLVPIIVAPNVEQDFQKTHSREAVRNSLTPANAKADHSQQKEQSKQATFTNGQL